MGEMFSCHYFMMIRVTYGVSLVSAWERIGYYNLFQLHYCIYEYIYNGSIASTLNDLT